MDKMDKMVKHFHRPDLGFFIIPKKKIVEIKSKFQKIEVFKHDFLGEVLRLGGYFQTSEFDEFLYHEPIVQFPLFSHPNPKKILIIGGGDGGILKEVTKHPSVEKITMVELDEQVVKVAKKYLTNTNKNAFEDKRVDLKIEDGLDFLQGTDMKFDIIILDVIVFSGLSIKLYTKDIYQLISKKLYKNGILSLHTLGYTYYPKIYSRIMATLNSVFKNVGVHSSFVPILGRPISFAICSNDIDFNKITKEDLNKRIQERKISDLRYFDGEIFKAALVVPKYLNEIMSTDTRILTIECPIEKFN